MVAPITIQDRENIIRLTIKQGNKVYTFVRQSAKGYILYLLPDCPWIYVNCKHAVACHARDLRFYIADSANRFTFTRLFHRSQAAVTKCGYLIL